MRPKVYPALERAIETGAHGAWRAAFNHDPKAPPSLSEAQHARLVDGITQSVLSAICEDFDFDEPDE
jgi:hypothetical protein